jgi:hypothetical protein
MRGLSLIELIMFIVIVGAAVAGIIMMISKTTQSSADPVIRKQALSIAEAMLDEIRLQPFTLCDVDDTTPGVVTVAAGPTVATQSGGSSLTFSHTTPAGSDRMLVVGISFDNDDRDVTGVTYGGTPLTFAGKRENSDDATAEIWYLVSPPVTTANVVVTLSGSISSSYGFVAAALPLNGVHQTTPTGTFQSSSGGGTSASLSVTSAASGDLVVGVYAAEQDSNSGSCAQGAGQTEHWDARGGSSGTTALACGMSEVSTGGTVTISVTTSNTDVWAMGAIPVKPSTCNEVIGPEPGETRYSATTPFDHVNDYHGFDSNTAVPTGIRTLDGTLIPGLDGYRVTVSVTGQALGGISNDASGKPQSLLITVTVTGPGDTTVVVSGYRTRYAPNETP